MTDNKEVDPGCSLMAGTAWLFAREEFDQELDYLFIDEAGQVSSANLRGHGVERPQYRARRRPNAVGPTDPGVHPASPVYRFSTISGRRGDHRSASGNISADDVSRMSRGRLPVHFGRRL